MRTILNENSHPLKKLIIEKYGSVQDFAYINGIDRSSLYYIFRNGKQKYLQDDMLLSLTIGLDMQEREIRELCCYRR